MLKLSPSIPVYDGGVIAPMLYNAGPMIADDRAGVTDEDCLMQLVSQTNEAEFKAYLAKLDSAGFKVIFENHTDAADAAQLKKDGLLLYVLYTKLTGEVRIFEDRASSELRSYGYSCEGDGVEVYQFGLYYDPQNRDTDKTMNCGMLYIIRLADNSLIMIDGAHRYQCTAAMIETLYAFLRRITGTVEGEKIRIAGWYITHAHSDHMAAGVRLLRAYPGVFKIERVMFNFLSYSVKRQEPDIYILKETLREFCPDVKMLKMHAGQRFSLGNAEFEVLYTHEDAVKPECADRFPLADYNCTSTILKMAAGGMSVMWLGDTNLETEALTIHTIPREMWKADVVQVAHHCFNFLSTLYEWIDADYALMPNSYFGSHTPENTPKLADVIAHLASPDNIWYEEVTTGIYLEKGEFKVFLEEAQVGGESDGIDLYGCKA
ncbi:MAG: hypothetical protein J6I45_03170 [Clostridia bacterium]|nr:hypothetical protein [Clostridia bacterium]